ncbi:aryl hydrocarbon receptor-like [Pygocentrus nattereri]|uniref:aryl hydrocarbon receptor-like n=1 Tax=Pygocentrus nattereri TaxID=42514 RepID=UPI0008146A7C|nr:aryl hydrocarbon receptor-like [Pygocentrus nattereri]
MYAVKKRKRPLQKILNAVNHDDAKSTPSKRHRDRLNGELDKLTALLPFSEDVRGRLDKLSILRLSVGYLKLKKFLQGTLRNSDGNALFCDNSGKTATSIDGVSFSEGDLLLQALNGFVLVVNTEGCIFYTSPTIQDCLGFHQSDLVQQSIYELIHIDDRAMFQCQLHFAFNPKNTGDVQSYSPQHLPPETSAFLERNFCCRFRCLLNNSSGFLALNFQGRLKYLRGEDHAVEGSSSAHSQLALFAIASPVQPPCILQIRTKTLIFQTKHRLDFAPLSIDTRGKMVLGYTEMELCTRKSGYQFIHAADMMYCADNHLRMIKTGESGFTVFRLLTKNGVWVWVQANARVVFQGKKPDFIIARQKPLTNDEGEEHLRQRRLQLPFSFAGEAVLYESLEVPELWNSLPRSTKRRRPAQQKDLDPDSLLGSLLRQDQSIYIHPPELEIDFPLDQAFMDSHALLSVPIDGWRTESVEPSFNQDSMLKSLEKILGKEGAEGALKKLEVDQIQLKDWEDALLRIRLEKGDGPTQLNDILANDVFSYVEEALLKETSMNSYKQTKCEETEMWKDTTFGVSQCDPVKLHQTCMLPEKPMKIHQTFRCSGRFTNSKPGGHRFEDQSTLNRRSMNDSHGFLDPLHSGSLGEGISCGSSPAAVSFQLQPESTNALNL